MSKYTPGPWRLNDNTKYWKTNIFSITVRKHGVSSSTVANIPARATIPVSEAWANARLIAAAPDLLEAVKAALSDDQPYIEKCKAAIAKATGKQP
jgi:hypothetical protein